MESKQLLTATIVEYPVPTPSHVVRGITEGADGNLWLTEPGNAAIASFNTQTHTFNEYPVPQEAGISSPYAITSGPDGNIWFADYGAFIGMLDLDSHIITRVPFPDGVFLPETITAGPDGKIWAGFSDPGGLIVVDPATLALEVITFTDRLDDVGRVYGITAGPDGNIWFTVPSGEIGMIDPVSHVITTFAIPSQSHSPVGITTGPDGKLWFTEVAEQRIGVIDPVSKQISEFPVPIATPSSITAGADGGIWFTGQSSATVGRIDPRTHAIEVYAIPSGNTFKGGIAAGPGGNIWFTEGANPNAIGEVQIPEHTLVLAPIADLSVNGGDTVAFTAKATDSDINSRSTYSLAPGAPAGATIDPNTGAFTWTPTSLGVFKVTVRVVDNAFTPLSASQEVTITVFNVAPTVTLGSDIATKPGGILTGTGTVTGPSNGVFTATIDYGDGSGPQPLALTPSRTFALDHIYTRAGSFLVAVEVKDKFGGVGSLTLPLTASAPPLVSGFGVGRDAFVTKLYQDNLGRLPEIAALSFWSRHLIAGASPKAIASAIRRTPEYAALLKQHLISPITLKRSLANALQAGKRAVRENLAPPTGPLILTIAQ